MIERALRLTREFHRMKQKELASKLNISNSYLSEIEAGKKPITIDLLEAYSKVFKVPVSTFFLFKDEIASPGDSARKKRAERLLGFFEWVIKEERA